MLRLVAVQGSVEWVRRKSARLLRPSTSYPVKLSLSGPRFAQGRLPWGARQFAELQGSLTFVRDSDNHSRVNGNYFSRYSCMKRIVA
jgi:hypothetical protein